MTPSTPRHGLRALATAIALSALSPSFVHAQVRPVTPAECEVMRTRHVLADPGPVACRRLFRVDFRFVDFDGQPHAGDLVVLDAVAPRVKAIFDTLYARRFPIRKAVPMEAYAGDDDASMADDNTSAFNARPVVGSREWSLHAYGLAIDLDPVENPFIDVDESGNTLHVLPAAATRGFVNRLNHRPRKDDRAGLAEDVVDVFADNGFVGWGGYWNFPIDYQHFEVASRRLAERLAETSPEEATRLFEAQVAAYAACMGRATPAPASASTSASARTPEHEAARAACAARSME